jgi:two-component system CheB/CheR fusion protein
MQEDPHPDAAEQRAILLDRELERLKAHLRDTVEQYDASIEELKAGNEALLAMNEELRSATEALETSREELRAVNEELAAVNRELKAKVEALGQANSDMRNLMEAAALAALFLDRELRITRCTPSAMALCNLVPEDVGKALPDLATPLAPPELAEDALRVLECLLPVEREVGPCGGAWYLARLLPYRTVEDRVAGVVVSFVDVKQRRQAA